MLLIALCYVLLMFQFLLIAVIMVLQSIFLIKILVFPVAAGCLMMSGNIKELTCWQPKVM